MKYNIDLLRNIILTISSNLEPDQYGDVDEIDTIEFVELSFRNYPANEVLYWIRQLMNANIIVPGRKYVDEPIAHIKDLSLSGYQFAESVKNPSVWEKIKPRLIGTAVDSIPALIEKAISFAIQFWV